MQMMLFCVCCLHVSLSPVIDAFFLLPRVNPSTVIILRLRMRYNKIKLFFLISSYYGNIFFFLRFQLRALYHRYPNFLFLPRCPLGFFCTNFQNVRFLSTSIFKTYGHVAQRMCAVWVPMTNKTIGLTLNTTLIKQHGQFILMSCSPFRLIYNVGPNGIHRTLQDG